MPPDNYSDGTIWLWLGNAPFIILEPHRLEGVFHLVRLHTWGDSGKQRRYIMPEAFIRLSFFTFLDVCCWPPRPSPPTYYASTWSFLLAMFEMSYSWPWCRLSHNKCHKYHSFWGIDHDVCEFPLQSFSQCWPYKSSWLFRTADDSNLLYYESGCCLFKQKYKR